MPALAALVQAARELLGYMDRNHCKYDVEVNLANDVRNALAALDAEQGAEVEVSEEMAQAAWGVWCGKHLQPGERETWDVERARQAIAAAMKARRV